MEQRSKFLQGILTILNMPHRKWKLQKYTIEISVADKSRYLRGQGDKLSVSKWTENTFQILTRCSKPS